jgi:hypothetical protein
VLILTVISDETAILLTNVAPSQKLEISDLSIWRKKNKNFCFKLGTNKKEYLLFRQRQEKIRLELKAEMSTH